MENFTTFIAEAATASFDLRPCTPVVFVMDNLSSQNREELAAVLPQNPKMTAVMLPLSEPHRRGLLGPQSTHQTAHCQQR